MSATDAQADLMRAENEIRKLVDALASARERALKLRHYIELQELYQSGGSLSGGTRAANSGRAAEIADAAKRVLKREGRPTKTPRLVNELGRDGVRMPSDNEKGYLSSVLSRASGIVSDRSRGWMLSEWVEAGGAPPIGESLDIESDETFGDDRNRFTSPDTDEAPLW